MTPSAGPCDPSGLQGQAAGLVSRAVAAVIDAVAVVGIVLTTQLGIEAVRHVLFAVPFRPLGLPAWLTTAYGCAVAVVYLAAGWTTAGRTPGDQVMGLRVTDRARQPLGFRRALSRAALCVAFPAGLLWIPFSRENASLQDVVAGTVVVHDWYYRPPGNGHTPGRDGMV